MTRTQTAPTQLISTFHALSDPTRLRIIEMLGAGERCVCELTDSLDAAQSRLSFHLKVLKDAGLVTDRKEGRWVYYTLASSAVLEAQRFLENIHEGKTNTPVKITRGKDTTWSFDATGCCG